MHARRIRTADAHGSVILQAEVATVPSRLVAQIHVPRILSASNSQMKKPIAWPFAVRAMTVAEATNAIRT